MDAILPEVLLRDVLCWTKAEWLQIFLSIAPSLFSLVTLPVAVAVVAGFLFVCFLVLFLLHYQKYLSTNNPGRKDFV